MIHCSIKDLDKLRTYSDYMNMAVDYILKNNLYDLKDGKTEIDGNKIYINKVSVEPKNADELFYEMHEKYIDIHIDLIGEESLMLLNSCETVEKEFDSENDYSLFNSHDYDVKIKLKNSFCVVFYPKEIHKTCIKLTSDKISKCIVKVLDIKDK